MRLRTEDRITLTLLSSAIAQILSWIATHTCLPIPTTWAYRFGAADLPTPALTETMDRTRKAFYEKHVKAKNAHKPLVITHTSISQSLHYLNHEAFRATCSGYSSPSPEEQQRSVEQAMKNMQQAQREAEEQIRKARLAQQELANSPEVMQLQLESEQKVKEAIAHFGL